MLETKRASTAHTVRRFNVDGETSNEELAMASQVLDESAAAPRIEDALDYVRFDEIARLADRASSYWRSTMLAAERGETLTVIVHCKQVGAVTREAFAIVKTLGSKEIAP
jgi:hypothetical protein